jgi:hypothetical protein
MADRWPGSNWRFWSDSFLIVPNAPVVTGTIFVLTLHVLLIAIFRSLYLLSFSVSFVLTFELSAMAISISRQGFSVLSCSTVSGSLLYYYYYYSSTLRNSETSAVLKTPEGIQLQLVALCQNRFVTVTMFLINILYSLWLCILMHHFVLMFVRFKTLPPLLDITGIAPSDSPVHCCLLWPSVRPLLKFVRRKHDVTSVKQVLRHRCINCLCFCRV